MHVVGLPTIECEPEDACCQLTHCKLRVQSVAAGSPTVDCEPRMRVTSLPTIDCEPKTDVTGLPIIECEPEDTCHRFTN